MGAIEKYIGIPYANLGRSFKGVDCWGLVKLFYANELQIDVPAYSSEYKTSINKKQVAKVIHRGSVDVSKWEQTTIPKYGDVIVFNLLGWPCHCGIWLNNSDFIHSLNGTQTCLERHGSITWQKRVAGIYRWAKSDQLQPTR